MRLFLAFHLIRAFGYFSKFPTQTKNFFSSLSCK